LRYLSLTIIVSILSLNLFLQPHLAQAQTTTPAPVPSKTPASTPIPAETNEPEAEPPLSGEETALQRPFTQTDLRVLTGNVQRPNGIIWYNDKLYSVCNGDWTIYELDSVTGSTQSYIYGVRNGHTLLVDELDEGEFDIWVPDYDTNTLLRVNPVQAPQPIATGLQGPWGIALLDEEHFLITNLTGNNIVQVNRDGTVDEVMNDLRSPTGLAIAEDIVFIANNGSARRSIEWVELDDLLEGDDVEPSPLVNGLQNTTGLIVGPDGMLYFAYALGTRGVIGRVDPVACMENGGCTNDQTEVVLYTDLAAPLAGLTLSDDMRLFVHTIFRPEIYWVQLPQ
jgi:hypothetical protein